MLGRQLYGTVQVMLHLLRTYRWNANVFYTTRYQEMRGSSQNPSQILQRRHCRSLLSHRECVNGIELAAPPSAKSDVRNLSILESTFLTERLTCTVCNKGVIRGDEMHLNRLES
jgi:hypothetical protein